MKLVAESWLNREQSFGGWAVRQFTFFNGCYRNLKDSVNLEKHHLDLKYGMWISWIYIIPKSKFMGSKFPGSRFMGSKFPGSRFLGSRFLGSKFLDLNFLDLDFSDLGILDLELYCPHVKGLPSESTRHLRFGHVQLILTNFIKLFQI